MSEDNAIKNIKLLYSNYKNDPYILNKLNNYINNELPNILSNAKEQYNNREHRKEILQEANNCFVKQFINNNKYFYSNTSEIFFYYDREHYTSIKEDNIIYTILSILRTRQDLIAWKFKIKTSVIKNIKEISILNSLPESHTIQYVQNIFEKSFSNKNEIKYFLTIIGDIILKKPININIISNNAKNMLRTIENIGGQYFGHISILSSFKFKYYDHNYNDCRILVYNNDNDLNDLVFKNIIDIIVVSCYYSNRYNSSDEFLESCDDSDFVERVLFLKNNNQNSIIEKFISSKIQNANNSIISVKNMLYLWKLYLEESQLPLIIQNNIFKNLLKNNLKYDEEKECFIDYTSNKIPFVSKFINFWDETIIENSNEYYLEIDEIYILFKNYCGINTKNIDINEKSILNMIQHFYPDIHIDGKFIFGIYSKQWNKNNDIMQYINKKILDYTNKNILDTSISLYELYNDYSTNYCKKNKNSIVINKNYFDMFICEQLCNNKNFNPDSILLSLFNTI